MTDACLWLALVSAGVWPQGQGIGDRRRVMCQIGAGRASLA